MVRCTLRNILLAIGACCLVAGGPAWAESPGIKDEGNVFSPEAKAQAEKVIEQIHRDYRLDLTIEFVPAMPQSGWWNKVKTWMLRSQDAKSRQRYYEDWAKRSARTAGPRSIYVLIVREPAPLHVEIAAGRDAQKKDGLPPADAKRLQAALQAAFQTGNYDASLEEAVRDVRRTLRDNHDAAAVPADGFPWAEIGSLITIMLGFWVCVQLMQKFLGNRDPERAVPLTGGYGEGGSYLAGLYAVMNSHGIQELFRYRPSREHPAPVVTAAPSPEEHEAVLADSTHHPTAGPEDYLRDNL